MTIEKEKELIELSDLNREDNIKYISSEAQGIAIKLDSDKYAPTFCKLERAYICGRRKSEEQITELISKLEELQEQNSEMFNTIALQEQQIEKMKCCGNCSHFKLDNSGLYPIKVCELTYPNRCKNHDKWEIEEDG